GSGVAGLPSDASAEEGAGRAGSSPSASWIARGTAGVVTNGTFGISSSLDGKNAAPKTTRMAMTGRKAAIVAQTNFATSTANSLMRSGSGQSGSSSSPPTVV